MVHIVRPVWDESAPTTSSAATSRRSLTRPPDADGLVRLEPAPRTVRGARDLLSVALQYGNAFGQGLQAAALKPADFFGNDDVLYLMEDMATGEIRLSILWEWLHKWRATHRRRPTIGVKAGDTFVRSCLPACSTKSTTNCSQPVTAMSTTIRTTTLPIAREIVDTYVTNRTKLPWYIDLLNLNLLNNHDLANAKSRIRSYIEAFERQERGSPRISILLSEPRSAYKMVQTGNQPQPRE